MTARLLSDKDLQLIRKFDKQPAARQEALLKEVDLWLRSWQGTNLCMSGSVDSMHAASQQGRSMMRTARVQFSAHLAQKPANHACSQDGPACMETLLTVLRNVTKEETVQYVLALLDEIISGRALTVTGVFGLGKRRWHLPDNWDRAWRCITPKHA